MFDALRIAASGLSANRFRLDLGAQNLANMETTRTAGGGPYQRQVADFRTTDEQGNPTGVSIVGVRGDPTLGPLIYDPSHPDANASGYVRMPNVDMTDEMIGLGDAKDGYNANATVFQAVRSMLQKSLSI
jgi:flagellar basal-body rod protein FlgC